MKISLIKMKNKAKRAFTLIEIMVATVIMVVLVGLVIQITSEVLKVWSRSSGKLAANAEARIAMDIITQDLETAVFRNNGQQWLRVQGPETTGGKYDGDTVSLKFFSPALDRPTGPGDICAIGYRLSYKQSYTGGPNVYALYRMIVDPELTFNSYMGSSSAASRPQESLTSALWADDLITADENYLVSNIVGFKVLVYEDDPSVAVSVPVNADASQELDADYMYGGTDATLTGGGGTQQLQLLYADVILTVVSDEGLELLRLLNDGRTGTGYKDVGADTAENQVVREHGETFTRRVNFMAHPF